MVVVGRLSVVNSFVSTQTRTHATTTMKDNINPNAAASPSTSTSLSLFNGGKMNHIFEFEKGIERGPKLYIPEFSSEEAKLALENGKLYYKIDGSNGMIVIIKSSSEAATTSATSSVDGEQEKMEEKVEEATTQEEDNLIDYQLSPYKRYDSRGKEPPPQCIKLPTANNPDSYEGHSYYYEPMNVDCKAKGIRKINEVVHEILNDHKQHIVNVATTSTAGATASGDNKDGNCDDNALTRTSYYVSVEWIGTKFQKTPGVPHNVAIAIHSQQVCEEQIERTYDGVRSFLSGEGGGEGNPIIIEGLIVEYNGTYYKVRSDCFDRKCLFKTKRELGKPPIEYLIPKREQQQQQQN